MTLPASSDLTPAAAWAKLVAGNRRFVAGQPAHPNQDAARRDEVTRGQEPFALLFGCADSRVAAEVVFDRGLGDLFVIRTAGHVAGESVLGSLEFGVGVLSIPLIVVLGHDRCGAVTATMQALDSGDMPPGHIADVVQRLLPGVLSARGQGISDAAAVGEEHVRQTVALLDERSAIIHERVREGRLGIVGARYSLRDGRAHYVCSRGPIDEPAPARPS